MNSEEIRDEIDNDNVFSSSSESVPSIFRDLSDPDDPTFIPSDLENISSDSDTNTPNLNADMDVNNEEDEAPDQGNLPPNEDDRDEIIVTKEGDVIVWQNIQGNLNDFDFTSKQPPRVSALASNRLDTHSALEFYSLFLDSDILDMLVNETNTVDMLNNVLSMLFQRKDVVMF